MDAISFSLATKVRNDKAQAVRTVTTSGSMTANSYRTDLTVSGAGTLHCVLWSNPGGASAVQVTVDGGTSYFLGDTYGDTTIGANLAGTSAAVNGVVVSSVRFKSSLVVAAYNPVLSTQTVKTSITYSLDV